MKLPNLSEKGKGILFLLCSAFCFACMSAMVKLSGDLPVFEKAFFRNAVAVVISFLLMKRDGLSFRYPRDGGKDVFFRSLLGTVGMVCNFYACSVMTLADANTLNKLSPFFAVFFSIFILKEAIRPFQIATLAGAFAGALLIIKPSAAGMVRLPGLIGLLGGACAGFAYTFLRRAARTGVARPVIVFWFSAFSCIVTAVLSLFHFVMPTGQQLIYLVLTGIFACTAQFCITAAYAHAPARDISVFDYSQVIFSTLIGIVLFRQLPDALSFLGYFIIIGMAVLSFVLTKKRLTK